MDLVTSIIQDRARAVAVKAVAEIFSNLVGGEPRQYVKSLLTEVASLVQGKQLFRNARLKRVCVILVKAALSEALVATRSPGSAGTDRAWRVDLAFWYLGKMRLLEDSKVEPPTCPFQKKEEAAIHCAPLFQGGELDEHKVAAHLEIERIEVAIRMIASLRQDGRIDVDSVLRALSKSNVIAILSEKHPGLDPAAWQNVIDQLAPLVQEGRKIVASLPRLRQTCAAGNLAEIRALAASLGKVLDETNLGSISLSAGELRSRLRDVAAATTCAEVAVAVFPSMEEALGRVTAAWAQLEDLRAAIVQTRRLFESQGLRKLAVDSLSPASVGELRKLIGTISRSVHALRELSDLVARPDEADELKKFRRALATIEKATLALDEVLEVVEILVAGGSPDAKSLGGIVKDLMLLRNDRSEWPIVELLLPVLDVIAAERRLTPDALISLIPKLPLSQLLSALGYPDVGDGDCGRTDRGCWIAVVVRAVQESIAVRDGRVQVDSGPITHGLARFGDDFRKREDGRWFFHLTVGTGTMRAFGTPGTGGVESDRWVPVVAEQVGVGYASEALFGDRLTFKGGAFASGILYRAVLDNQEADAVMFGAFFAADLYGTIEAFVAPTLLYYPPGDGADSATRFGLTFGLQVPLGDYLADLGD